MTIKRDCHFLSFVFLLLLLMVVPCGASGKQPVDTSCLSCHDRFASILPLKHDNVEGKDLTACLPCHVPQKGAEKPRIDPYSAKLHLAHIDSKNGVDCQVCHPWTPGQSFGIVAQSESWGGPSEETLRLLTDMFRSWANSKYLDALHAKHGVTCSGCHEKKVPIAGSEVSNNRCLACHGPIEKLAEKSTPTEFPKRNPHSSHLIGVSCTKCHQGHGESTVYCLKCHKGFSMKIPGGK